MNSTGMRRRTVLLASGAMCLRAAAPERFDVVVYGATPGGIVSNGLTNADIGKRQAVGGLFFEFTRRVVKYYDQMDRDDPARPNVKLCHDGYWYEANAAEKIFHEMLGEQGGRVRLLLGPELRRTRVRRGRLDEIEAGGTLLRAAVFGRRDVRGGPGRHGGRTVPNRARIPGRGRRAARGADLHEIRVHRTAAGLDG